MKRIVVFALVLNAALLGGGLLIGASLAAQEAVFSTGFEAGEGYIGAATAGPARLLVANKTGRRSSVTTISTCIPTLATKSPGAPLVAAPLRTSHQ